MIDDKFTEFDASQGEGGGQVLRTLLSLSIISGKSIHLHSIRARRPKPGLAVQHLVCIKAAAELSGASVSGAFFGSQSLYFSPGKVRHGKYHFKIDTAGSSTLVFQTVIPALLKCPGDSHFIFEGGTHNPLAPCFDFLDEVYLPYLRDMGVQCELLIKKKGFFPIGGGLWEAHLNVPVQLKPIKPILAKPDFHTHLTVLHPRVTHSQIQETMERLIMSLQLNSRQISWDASPDSPGPGLALLLRYKNKADQSCFNMESSLNGPRQKFLDQADKLIRDVNYFQRFLVPVGRYLADQLILPMALSGFGHFRTCPLSNHCKTQIDLVNKFLKFPIESRDVENGAIDLTIGVNS